MSGDALVLFEGLSLLGFCLIAIKLIRTGLYRRYRILFACFVFHVPYLACVIWFTATSIKTAAYLNFWLCTEPLLWAFYVLIVFELFRLILERHKGLYTLGRWAMYLGIGVSVTLSILSLLPKISATMPQRSRLLRYAMGAERGIDLSLAIFLIFMLFLLSRYPVPLSRNVIVNSTVFTVFFLSSTLTILLARVFGLRVYSTLSTWMEGVSAACVLAWLFLLTPKGEEVQFNVPHFGPEHEQRILQQLDALNATLLRVSRN